jgi:two-component system response regulator DesR
MSTPIRVLCVDDNPKLTAAWDRLVGQQPDMEIVGLLHSADDLVPRAIELKPDVVLLDLTMDGRDPLDAAVELARVAPAARILIYSGHNDQDVIDRAMDAGAWGFVGKDDEPTRILEAIRAIAGGQTFVP